MTTSDSWPAIMLDLNNILFIKYSQVMLIPSLLTMLYKFLYPADIQRLYAKGLKPGELPKSFQGTFDHKLDQFMKFFMTYGYFYYLVDSLGRVLVNPTDLCTVPFTWHHLVTVFYLKDILRIKYFPWHQLGIYAIHNLLICYPDYKANECLYGLVGILSHYGIRQEPLANDYFQRSFDRMICILYPSFVMLLAIPCNNVLKMFSSKFSTFNAYGWDLSNLF